MTLLEEYRKSLKMAEVEEVIDLALNRPIAFGLVRLIYRLPITPNQITFLSLLSGLASGYCFSLGQFALGGIWYAVANLLDCMDGQLARLQHSGTPLGRLVDGVVDWVISVAIFTGVGIGMAAATGTQAIWYLVVAGGLSSAFHAIVFDYYQQDYLSTVRGEENFLMREMTRSREELARLRDTRERSFRWFVLFLYLQYLGVQQRSQIKKGPSRPYPAPLFRRHNKHIMRWWTFLGATTNRSMLIVAGILGRPEVFLWVAVVPANLYLIAMFLWQRRVQAGLDLALNREPAPPGQEQRVGG